MTKTQTTRLDLYQFSAGTDPVFSRAEWNAMTSKVEAFVPSRTGRLTVASSELPADVRDQCDYACDGTDDQVQINAALLRASRPSDGFGGEGYVGVELVGPTFDVGHNGAAITMYPSTQLWGNGIGTLVRPNYATNLDKGVVELINSATANVRLSHFTIGRHNAVAFNGHGVKFIGTGSGSTYEIKSGSDQNVWVEAVNVMFAGRKGIYLGGTSGGVRGSQIYNCRAWSSSEEGIYVDGASDVHVSQCIANGGGDYPRFHIGGGNSKVADCKAFYSGNRGGSVGANGQEGALADGFNITSSRIEIQNCAAQDNGRWGFRFSGSDVLAGNLAADSNQRASGASTGGGYEVATDGVFEALHAYDRGQTASSPQVRGIVFSGTRQVYLTGRVKVPSGSSHVVGSPASNSYMRVVRDGTTLSSAG